MTNHIFFTQANQLASNAVTGDVKFNQMESLVRSGVRAGFRYNILRGLNAQNEARSTDMFKTEKTLSTLGTLSNYVHSGRSTLPDGCQNKDDIHELFHMVNYKSAAVAQVWAKRRFPRAFVRTELKGLDRAYMDGVPNVAFEELSKFYQQFLKLYRHYAHLNSPFMVAVNNTVSHDQIRWIAETSGDNRFYGMATSSQWYEDARLLLDPTEYLSEFTYRERLEMADRASPNDPAVMLGLMMAYLSANHNGDKPAGLIGHPRDASLEPIRVQEKFYMNIMEVPAQYGMVYVLTFGEADKQQMLFAIPPLMAERIMDIVTFSKGGI